MRSRHHCRYSGTRQSIVQTLINSQSFSCRRKLFIQQITAAKSFHYGYSDAQAAAGFIQRFPLRIHIHKLPVIIFPIPKRITVFIRRRQVIAGRQYVITARFGDKTVLLDAALDTGNCVTDFGGNGVMLADMTSVLKQLDFDAVSRLMRTRQQSFFCSTVNGGGSLKGFLPDELTITDRRKSYKAKGYIALCDAISFKGCNALLPDHLRMV